MAEEYEHLQFERERVSNPRRKGQRRYFHTREDKAAHGRKMQSALNNVRPKLAEQHASRPNAVVLKLHYKGTLSIEKLQSHGLDFIGQDGNEVCIVFSTEAGIAKFSDHLQRLGLGELVTDRQLLEALTGIDQWSAHDRMSWAVWEIGLPETEKFALDVSLWPLGEAASREREELKACFENWLSENHITRQDKVSLDSLLMYRLVVDSVKAEMLLNHVDVRQVDLPPRPGITVTQLTKNIETIPYSFFLRGAALVFLWLRSDVDLIQTVVFRSLPITPEGRADHTYVS